MSDRIELRCTGPQLHGIVDRDSKTIEVRCKRRRCGVRPGVVVIHTYALDSGRLLKTERFRDPKEVKDDTTHSTSVRSA